MHKAYAFSTVFELFAIFFSGRSQKDLPFNFTRSSESVCSQESTAVDLSLFVFLLFSSLHAFRTAGRTDALLYLGGDGRTVRTALMEGGHHFVCSSQLEVGDRQLRLSWLMMLARRVALWERNSFLYPSNSS